MAKIERTLCVEKALDSQESKRDIEVLSDISKDLPSAARIKIYKKDEENKAFIASISAEDFSNSDPHEFIKTKYVKKHGGGDYLIELLDSNGRAVDRRIVSIVEENKEKPVEETKSAKIINEALDMREEAFGKIKEAEKEKREAEKTKYETMIGAMERQWDTIQKMYESQVSVLKEQMDKTKDPNSQLMVQMQLEKISRDFEASKRDIETKMQQGQEGKLASDKMFDLVNNLIPLILQKSTQEGKDPVDELSKTITLVNNLTGGKKDIIESFIENPERMQVFQKLLGISSNGGKKDLFEDILENPAKADMFKKLLGVEDKKDFLLEMMENPSKFEIFKKITGIDKQDELVKEVKKMGESLILKDVTTEPPKGFMDELIDAKTKFETLKSLFNPSQPAKTFVELISTVITGAGPHIANAVNSYMNGMITLEMIKKGMINKENVPPGMQAQITGQGFQGTGNISEQPKKTIEEKPAGGHKELNIEDTFKEIIVKIVEASKDEQIDGTVFIDRISKNVVLNVKRNPSLILQIVKYGGFEEITGKMSIILIETLGFEKTVADEFAKQIADNVVEGIKGGGQ